MSEHTPGPWGCVDTSYHAHDYRLTKPNGQPLPLTVVANDHSEQRANARLIAAAPDLLEALYSMRHAAMLLHDLHNDSDQVEVDIAHDAFYNAEARYKAAISRIDRTEKRGGRDVW